MNDVFLLYLLTRLDNIQLFCFLALIVGLFVQWYGLSCLMEDPDEWASEHFKIRASKERSKGKSITKNSWLLLIPALILVALPSKQDAMFIIAGTGVIEAAKSDTAQRLASKSVNVVEKYLDEMLKEDKK